MQLAENFPERLLGVCNIHQIDVAHQYQFHCQASFGCHDWHPAIAKPGSTRYSGVRQTPKPDRDRALHRRGHDADFLEIVEAPIEAHEVLRPKATEHLNLFGLARSSRLPLRAERFIL